MESLISDLAFILLLGAVVTLVFKWIRQPVVLGYIVAGFLASPHFEALPSVTTEENIEFWAQLGIIVLLFSLGLEFSFRRLVNTGGSAVVTALVIVAGMMGLGFVAGHLMGFSTINCLFLGGMLSMSSTTIIIKAFTDMGLRHQRFAGLVLAVLIVEDLFAVVMMVVLSSIAAGSGVSGSDLLLSVGSLVFFLVIWFLGGVLLVPSLLRRARRWLNDETLLVVSMGLCLGMAVLALVCGFSLALGAFVMGSILGGTSWAERIEHVTAGVKDLFGSIFFISVGMMVQPAVIGVYWGPILGLSGLVIVGMILFGTMGMLVTGQGLREAICAGFSLTQIGEFAFIIATLGMSLGVLSGEIYPIVVAVSVLTTFTTPYFIRMAPGVAAWVEGHLPRGVVEGLERYRRQVSEERNEGRATGAIVALVRRYLWRILLYSIVLIALSIASRRWALPMGVEMFGERLGRIAAVAATLVVMSPFLLALCLPPRGRKEEGKKVKKDGWPRVAMMVLRVALAVAFIVHTLGMALPLATGALIAIAMVCLVGILLSRRLRRHLRGLERRFALNLDERELRRSGRGNTLVSDLRVAYIRVGYGSPVAGERLAASGLRGNYGVSVVSIQRPDGSGVRVIPDGQERLFPGDTVGVVGTDEQIGNVLPVMEDEGTGKTDEGRGKTEEGLMVKGEIALRSLTVGEGWWLEGSTVAGAEVRGRLGIHVVALQREGVYLPHPATTEVKMDDRLWYIGPRPASSSLEG